MVWDIHMRYYAIHEVGVADSKTQVADILVRSEVPRRAQACYGARRRHGIARRSAKRRTFL